MALFYFLLRSYCCHQLFLVVLFFLLYFSIFIHKLEKLMVSVSDNGVTGVSFFVVTHEMYGFYNWHTAGLGITLSHYSLLMHVFYCGLSHPPPLYCTIWPNNRQTLDGQPSVGIKPDQTHKPHTLPVKTACACVNALVPQRETLFCYLIG